MLIQYCPQLFVQISIDFNSVFLGGFQVERVYTKEAPSISEDADDAEAAKLKKFSDAGGFEVGGCPTRVETNF